MLVINLDLNLSICSCFSNLPHLSYSFDLSQEGNKLTFRKSNPSSPFEEEMRDLAKISFSEQTKRFFQYKFAGLISEYKLFSK